MDSGRVGEQNLALGDVIPEIPASGRSPCSLHAGLAEPLVLCGRRTAGRLRLCAVGDEKP